jgi:hypothetical protein
VACWNPNVTCAIIAHEREAVTKIFEIVKRAYESMPDELRPVTRYDNKNELQFLKAFDGTPLNSKIYVSLKLRSGTVQRLHISEAAYIEKRKRQELNSGSKQAVPLEGYITEETTANGFNEFYEEVMDAIEFWDKEDGIPQKYKKKVHFFSWLEDDEYTIKLKEPLTNLDQEEERLIKLGATHGHLAWRRLKLRDFSKSSKGDSLNPIQLFKQEYPATLEEAFQSSGNTFFDYELIELIKPRDYKMSSQVINLKQWYEPEERKKYFVGVDPSNGKNIDFVGISVWDDEYRQCAQWHGYKDPDEVAHLAKEIAELYKNAKIIVENNLITTILELVKIYNKANIYRYTRENRITKQKSLEYGFNTNRQTRRQLTDSFRKLLREGILEINSQLTKNEMMTFIINQSDQPEHSAGQHDDALFGDMLAVHYVSKPDWMDLYK